MKILLQLKAEQLHFCKEAPHLVSPTGSSVVVCEAAASTGLHWQEGASLLQLEVKSFTHCTVLRADKTHSRAHIGKERVSKSGNT